MLQPKQTEINLLVFRLGKVLIKICNVYLCVWTYISIQTTLVDNLDLYNTRKFNGACYNAN